MPASRYHNDGGSGGAVVRGKGGSDGRMVNVGYDMIAFFASSDGLLRVLAFRTRRTVRPQEDSLRFGGGKRTAQDHRDKDSVQDASEYADDRGHDCRRVRLRNSGTRGNCHFAGSSQLRNRIARGQKFHRDRAPVFQLANPAKYAFLINLARAGLVPTRNIRDVHQGHVRNVLLELVNQIALGNLLVEEIVQELDLWMIDCI